MMIRQTESYVNFVYYSESLLFTHEIYFGIVVVVGEYQNGDKNFNIEIIAVGLKTSNLSFRLDLSVSTSGKTIPQEKRLLTTEIENHDGSDYETLQTYDYVPAEEIEIVLRNIEIKSYLKEDFETKEFLISLPTRSTYITSRKVGDYRWYQSYSPKQSTSEGKRY